MFSRANTESGINNSTPHTPPPKYNVRPSLHACGNCSSDCTKPDIGRRQPACLFRRRGAQSSGSQASYRNLFARAPVAPHAAVARARVLCCEPHVSYTSTSDQIGGCSTRSVTTIGAAGKAAGGDAATIAAAAAARAPGGSEDGAVLKGGWANSMSSAAGGMVPSCGGGSFEPVVADSGLRGEGGRSRSNT